MFCARYTLTTYDLKFSARQAFRLFKKGFFRLKNKNVKKRASGLNLFSLLESYYVLPLSGGVSDREVGCYLEPKGNGVNPGGGDEGGPGPPSREQDKQ